MNPFLQPASRRQPSGRVRRLAHRGFTLAETLISVGIMSVVMVMVLQFKMDTMRSLYISEEKGKINSDVRAITNEMSDVARDANFFVLYRTYAVVDRTSASQQLTQANAGDFLVLIFFGDPPDPVKFNVRPIKRIVGYYRAPLQAGEQAYGVLAADANSLPVRKFDLTVANGGVPASSYLTAMGMPSGGTVRTIESMLPNANSSTILSHKRIVQFVQGLDNGYLFYNFMGKSVMVNGKILHGNDAKRVTDTYNFTITPRN